MSSFKIVFADEPKIRRNNPARAPDRVFLTALAAVIGAAFLIAFYYSISDLSQAMAAAVLSSLYS